MPWTVETNIVSPMKLIEIASVMTGICDTTDTLLDWAACAGAAASRQAAASPSTDMRLVMSVATPHLPRTCDDRPKVSRRVQLNGGEPIRDVQGLVQEPFQGGAPHSMTLKLSHFATRGRIVISLVAMTAALAAAVVLQSAGGSAILPGSSQPGQLITLSAVTAEKPTAKVEVIVQLRPSADPA